jgi:xylose isomerase
LNAAAMIEGGELAGLVKDRYAGWQGADAQAMLSGNMSLESIADAVVSTGVDPQPRSGRQEYVENLVSRYI